jgi:hypothetical protein
MCILYSVVAGFLASFYWTTTYSVLLAAFSTPAVSLTDLINSLRWEVWGTDQTDWLRPHNPYEVRRMGWAGPPPATERSYVERLGQWPMINSIGNRSVAQTAKKIDTSYYTHSTLVLDIAPVSAPVTWAFC